MPRSVPFAIVQMVSGRSVELPIEYPCTLLRSSMVSLKLICYLGRWSNCLSEPRELAWVPVWVALVVESELAWLSQATCVRSAAVPSSPAKLVL